MGEGQPPMGWLPTGVATHSQAHYRGGQAAVRAACSAVPTDSSCCLWAQCLWAGLRSRWPCEAMPTHRGYRLRSMAAAY
ncbi:hypothetical protein B296_00033967 [Ensete ventricosum]|uniref:Uncharacterized protein n=1 Tax=Ensete ventricosum TaxID=4639 RepID=A0A427A096_ENSVE|nr:hypothetical protein B296_00033967 [Ensete ventricosum]